MALIAAFLIVCIVVNHAFKGTNPVAFIIDCILVLAIASQLASC